METRANYTMVGAFVIFFLVAIVTFILWVARIDFSRNAIEYDIYFSGSVTGLKEGGQFYIGVFRLEQSKPLLWTLAMWRGSR